MFDCEELLETSIKSIRKHAEYVVVVYQKVSNFGDLCNPYLEKHLNDLCKRKLIDEIILYTPRPFSVEEKIALTATIPDPKELHFGHEYIGDQFLNELSKREIGRAKCLENGCSHFICMDSDEYYLDNQITFAKEKILKNDYDATFCKMRTFFMDAIYEYLPLDENNSVPFICKCTKDLKHRLACHYVNLMIDPTRRLEGIKNTYSFKRDELEMFHMTLVRKNLRKKLFNVSNKANYTDCEAFMEKWDNWTPEHGPIHPHSLMKDYFKSFRITENYFNINISEQCYTCCKSYDLQRCSKCKSIRYCSKECQTADWKYHKQECKKVV